MNPDAFHDATHIALALREDVALTAEGGGLVLRGRTRGLRFSTVSQSQHAALAALARPNGATEVELEELIAATDGPDDLAAWFFRLDQLLQTNLLRQVVVADDVPLISAWTMRGSGLSPVTANSGDRTFKMSRFAMFTRKATGCWPKPRYRPPASPFTIQGPRPCLRHLPSRGM